MRHWRAHAIPQQGRDNRAFPFTTRRTAEQLLTFFDSLDDASSLASDRNSSAPWRRTSGRSPGRASCASCRITDSTTATAGSARTATAAIRPRRWWCRAQRSCRGSDTVTVGGVRAGRGVTII
ncbi:MAG: hypothetical protein AB2L14_12835 [Candidatus Xenobiia bacterium LiM19]